MPKIDPQSSRARLLKSREFSKNGPSKIPNLELGLVITKPNRITREDFLKYLDLRSTGTHSMASMNFGAALLNMPIGIYRSIFLNFRYLCRKFLSKDAPL